MLRIKLAVVDCDQNYLNRLSAAFGSMFADKLEVHYFTDFSIVKNEMQTGMQIDVLLVDAGMNIDLSDVPEKCAAAYFCESNDIEALNDQRTIGKYQKVDVIYREILSLYSDKASENMDFKHNLNNDCAIVTFLSAAGGTGASTAAAAYCVRCARKGIRVLYLNFENIGSTGMFFNAEGIGNFKNIIFALKSQKSNLPLKLDSEVKQSAEGVSYFEECEIALDKVSLTMEDKLKLINELIIKGNYSKIVIDMNFTPEEPNIGLLNKCDKIIFVSDGSAAANLKTEKVLKSIQILEQQDEKVRILCKSNLLYNKFSSKYSTQIENNCIGLIGGINRIEGVSSADLSRKISEYSVLDKI